MDARRPGRQEADELAQALKQVPNARVTKEEASALGFWHEDAPDDNPMVDAEGRSKCRSGAMH